MKKLFLLRHAKSSWDDASLADFDRPLNDRGKRAAPFMGRLMRRNGFLPEIIVSSPAKRARKTAKLARDAGEIDAEIVFDKRIYGASPMDLCALVAELDDVLVSAMLVGHNPGMEGFIRYLTGHIEPFPTAALAVIDLDINKWADVIDSSGKMVRVFRPKEAMH